MANHYGFPEFLVITRSSVFEKTKPNPGDVNMERCRVCGCFVSDHEKHCPRGTASPPENDASEKE